MRAVPPAEIAAQLSGAQAILQRHLGGTLQAVHLFGSAIDGGLKPHSDIDLLATVVAPLPESVRRALMTDLLAVSAWPATRSLRPLEVTVVTRDAVVPWRYPPMRELQFGEWLRKDLAQGRVEPAVQDHDLAILLTKVRQHSLPLTGPPASEFFPPVPTRDLARALYDTIAQWNRPEDWQGDERNVVLALARVWFSLSTGRIAPKDVAAQWALERLPDEHQAVLAAARSSYLGKTPDELARSGAQVAAFVRAAKTAIEQAGPAALPDS